MAEESMADLSSDTANTGKGIVEAEHTTATARSTEYDGCLHYSPRAPWSVVLLAFLMVVVMAGWLELLHRADVREQLGRPPETWSDRQVRDFSTGVAYITLGVADQFDRWMVRVIEQRPSGEVAAAAASYVSFMGMGKQVSVAERERYEKLATEIVPTDSPRFTVYYSTFATEAANQGKLGEAETVLRAGITRAATDEQRATLADRLLYIEKEHLGAEEALATYEEFAAQHPDLVTGDNIRYTHADLLNAVGRNAGARNIWADLANNAGDPIWRDQARKQLSETAGGELTGN